MESGLSLERIKQNLRLRSGRSKKLRKPIAQPPLAAQSKGPAQNQGSNSTGNGGKQPASSSAENSHSPVKKEPAIRDRDSDTTKPQLSSDDTTNPSKSRQGLPRADTASNLDPHLPEESLRYGRSGIEKVPRREPTSNIPRLQRSMSEADNKEGWHSDSSEVLDFDLRPPPPRPRPRSVEALAESLWSPGHLSILLNDQQYLTRFTAFLSKYQTQYHAVVLRYLETQKAIKAIEYANAIAETFRPSQTNDSSSPNPSIAATLDHGFEESSRAAFGLLVGAALPMYISFNLVKVVTECLINEITGRQTPLTRDLVGGLSEVFCLADPNQEDTPIIYASEEFYRLTGYGADDVIGRNCRFLQGPKTKRDSVSRLKDSIRNGDEICETLLNYRRDGRPFINLLMIAPLHDDQGNVKYHIGAQIDVTGLIERVKGLDGFAHYLLSQDTQKRDRELQGGAIHGEDKGPPASKALAKLRELSEMFDLEESAVVRSHSRSTSSTREDFDVRSVESSRRAARRVYADEDDYSDSEAEEPDGRRNDTWRLGQSGQSGPSGKLPGVYDSYMLIRAAPSLRIVFISPKLRRRFGSVTQHPFLSHVAAPPATLAGLKESFQAGVPVSARIAFMLEAGARRDGSTMLPGTKQEASGNHRMCWIAATPLLGSDDKIGVWMIVVVEKAKVPTTNQVRHEAEARSRSSQRDLPGGMNPLPRHSSQSRHRSSSRNGFERRNSEDKPLKPKKLDDTVEGRQTMTALMKPTDQGLLDKEQEEAGTNHNTQQSSDVERQALPAITETDQRTEMVGSERSPDQDDPEIPDDTIDEFIRPKLQPQESHKSQRVVVRADSESETQVPAASENDDAVRHSLGEMTTPPRMSWASSSDAEMHQEWTPCNGLSDDEETPRRPQHLGFSDDTLSPSRPGTSGKDSSSGMKNGKHYMDYLRHPGSRPSSEYGRTVSGSGVLSSMYHGETIPGVDDGDDFNDLECASPYSVD